MDEIEDEFEPGSRGARVGQVVRWYLNDARDTGVLTDDEIAHLRDMSEQYLSNRFKALRFSELDQIDYQRAIDRAASHGAEKASVVLQRLFSGLDKYGLREGLIDAVRVKRLQCPSIDLKPRALTDTQYRAAWEAYSLCARGGAVVDRSPSLAVLVSAVTLQPLGNVVRMRREDVRLEERLWTPGDPATYVYLSDKAIELILSALGLADFVHREVPTPFVFPSAGSKRDPFRVVSYSGIFDLSRRLVSRQSTPHDLRKTGVDALKALGNAEMHALAKAITSGGLETEPSAVHVSLVEGWAAHIEEMTKSSWR